MKLEEEEKEIKEVPRRPNIDINIREGVNDTKVALAKNKNEAEKKGHQI